MAEDTASGQSKDVFISYAREDASWVNQIIREFEKRGLQCWIDITGIPAGATSFPKHIDRALNSAKALVVLWTRNSIGRDWTLSEANGGLQQNKLYQLVIGDVQIPRPFDQHQAVKLEVQGGSDEIVVAGLVNFIETIRASLGVKGPNERIIQPRKLSEVWSCTDLALHGPVPGTDIFSSFHPCGYSGIFSLMRVETTNGWVDERLPGAVRLHQPFRDDNPAYYDEYESGGNARRNNRSRSRYLKTKNEVFFINDPVRPYSIQIGGLRSQRRHAKPVPIILNLNEAGLSQVSKASPGMCEFLAEILEDEGALNQLWTEIETQSGLWRDLSVPERRDEVDRIRDLIARNPNSEKQKQQARCVFCKDLMQDKLALTLEEKEQGLGAYLVTNSFPFGPYFHYIVVTIDPVHTWEDLEVKHVFGMNLLTFRYLKRKFDDPDDPVIRQAAGIAFGFNSTVKHLVLGRRTQSSAGASIPHIHKQIWGMAPRTSNLAEQLITVSDAYWRQGIDYQGNYLAALEERASEGYGYVIWGDANVMLYVPYGQCSLHELQVMTCKPRAHLLDLSEDEIASLSKAEYIALRLYKELGVASFNHIVLSKLFNDNRAPTFRMVVIFVTRDSDLAMSELSMLYVADKHPWDSRVEIQEAWTVIGADVMSKINAECTSSQWRMSPSRFPPP